MGILQFVPTLFTLHYANFRKTTKSQKKNMQTKDPLHFVKKLVKCKKNHQKIFVQALLKITFSVKVY